MKTTLSFILNRCHGLELAYSLGKHFKHMLLKCWDRSSLYCYETNEILDSLQKHCVD